MIMGDVARKAIHQVYETVYALIRDKMPEEQAQEIARALSEGRWTHDYPIDYEQAKALGLPVSDEMPREIYDLMDLPPHPIAPKTRIRCIIDNRQATTFVPFASFVYLVAG